MLLRTRLSQLGFLAVLFASLAILGHAQYSGKVQGTVTDPNGAVIPGATVTLTNTATNIRNEAKTNDAGVYHFENLLPSDYRIEVTAPGFEKAVTLRHVATDDVEGVNFALTVGASTASVEVTSIVEGLNPDETRLQYTLQSKDLSNLPMPDRATITTLRVAPGVVGTIETNGSTNSNIPIGQAAPDARANGRPSASNVYLLDRIPISSTENTGALNMVPNPDMLAEIALQTTSFSVENGATSSLQVDFTSKSGGNQFHGDFDFSYSSKPFEAAPDFGGVSPFHRKYFMGSFGGPIIKDHTFFFGSIERIDNLSALGGQATEFDAANIGAWVQQQYAQPMAGWNTNGAPWAKLFTYPADGLVNQTVASRGSDYYPADGSQKFGVTCGQASSFYLPCDMPVTVTGEFNQNPGITGQQYNLRFDHSMRQDNDKFYIGYFGLQQNSDYIDPRPAFNTKTPSQAYYFSGGWSHVFTPSLINQLNVGLNRYWGGQDPNPNFAIFPHGTLFSFMQDPGGVGFAGGPQMSPDTPYLGGNTKEHIFALRDYVNWTKSRHDFKFGFQFALRNYWLNASKNYSRPYNTYFSDLLEMFQGEADEYSLYTIGADTGKWTSQVYGAQQAQFALYAQDDWKIRPNLQVSFGLRWDDFGNPSKYGEGAALYANTYLGSGNTLADQVAGAYAKTVSQAFTDGQVWNFLPRVAVTYSPTFAKDFVIRGGFGLYQDAINLNQITANLPTTTPVRLTLTLHDAAEPFACFFCGTGQWTGQSGVAGEPAPFAIVGTQGNVAPFGIPYPEIPVAGFTDRGLAKGPGDTIYQSDMYGVDPSLKPQSTLIWNFGVEKGLPNSIVLGATYTGSKSYDLFLSSGAFNNPPGSALSAGAPGYAAIPWSQVGKVQLIENMLSANYNGLILTAQQRKGRASWQASYLWSHSLGNPGSGDNPSAYEATKYYGTTNLDVRQRLTFSGNYELAGGVSPLSKGWSLGAVFIAQDGTPFTVYTSQDANNDTNKDGANDLPNLAIQPGSGVHLGKYSNAQYKAGIFNQCGGGPAGSGSTYDPVNYPLCPFQAVDNTNGPTEGNEPYNAFKNPGYWDVDVNLQKKFELPWFSEQKSHLNLRFEAMNVFNHANLNGFGTSIVIGSTTNFGQILSAANPRIMQIGGRFEF